MRSGAAERRNARRKSVRRRVSASERRRYSGRWERRFESGTKSASSTSERRRSSSLKRCLSIWYARRP